MIPTVETDHVATALGHVTQQFKDDPVLKGFLVSYINRCQEIETALWEVINSRLMSAPPAGDQLTQIGNIVGEKRLGRVDSDLLVAVRLRIRVNRSQGRAEDIIQIANLLKTAGTTTHYVDYPPKQFLIELWDLISPGTAIEMLTDARDLGTYGELHYSTWPDGTDVGLTSRYDSSQGQQGFGSRYDATAGGTLVAGATLTKAA